MKFVAYIKTHPLVDIFIFRERQKKVENFQKRAIAYKCAQIEIFIRQRPIKGNFDLVRAHARSMETPLKDYQMSDI